MSKTQTTITLQHVQEALGGLKVQQGPPSPNSSHLGYMLHTKIARELTDFLLTKREEGTVAMTAVLKTQQERAQVSNLAQHLFTLITLVYLYYIHLHLYLEFKYYLFALHVIYLVVIIDFFMYSRNING